MQVGACERMHTAKTRELFLARLLRAKASKAVVGDIETAKGLNNQQVPITQTGQTITGLAKWNQKYFSFLSLLHYCLY